MKPGRLPKAEDVQWKNMLGLDDAATAKPGQPAVPAKSMAGNFIAKTAPAAAVQRSAPTSPRTAARPVRENKKRRYDDSSFSGYGEGFDDDGYSTGDGTGRRGSVSKRQKRKVSRYGYQE